MEMKNDSYFSYNFSEYILIESSLSSSLNFNEHKKLIMSDLKKYAKDNFKIDLKEFN